MKINTECPECNAEIEIDISKNDNQIKCPNCNKIINVSVSDNNNSIDKLDDVLNKLDK